MIDGDSLGIFPYPLEQVFGNDNPRPQEIFDDEEWCVSTACWRGYEAVWKLKRDSLYLTDVRHCCNGRSLPEERLNTLIEGRYRNGHAFADWFTGDVVAPQGELLRYEHVGYGGISEREVVFRFEQGHLVARDTISNVPTREPSFPGGMEAFRRYVAENVDWGQIPEKDRRAFAVVVVDTLGVASVDTVYRAASAEVAKSIVRAVAAAPRWEPGYERGEKKAYRWTVSIGHRPNRQE